MNKIIDNFSVGKYNILVMDNEIPNSAFSFVKIDSIVHKVIIPYDFPSSIAIEAEGNFKGKNVEFL